jgi:hypothetical protein
MTRESGKRCRGSANKPYESYSSHKRANVVAFSDCSGGNQCSLDAPSAGMCRGERRSIRFNTGNGQKRLKSGHTGSDYDSIHTLPL